MQLKTTTDYAIRIILFLAQRGQTCSTAEIAQAMGIPVTYLPKVTNELRKSGLVKTHVGILGGLTIAKEPQQITLLDIISSMEATFQINRCLEPDEYCSRSATQECPVRKSYQKLQTVLEKTLGGITVADLM